MTGKRSPFFGTRSKEKLANRGSLASVDEFLLYIGFTRQLDHVFPFPGFGKVTQNIDTVSLSVQNLLKSTQSLSSFNKPNVATPPRSLKEFY